MQTTEHFTGRFSTGLSTVKSKVYNFYKLSTQDYKSRVNKQTLPRVNGVPGR